MPYTVDTVVLVAVAVVMIIIAVLLQVHACSFAQYVSTVWYDITI